MERKVWVAVATIETLLCAGVGRAIFIFLFLSVYIVTIISNGSKLFQIASNCSKCFKLEVKCLEWLQVLEMFENVIFFCPAPNLRETFSRTVKILKSWWCKKWKKDIKRIKHIKEYSLPSASVSFFHVSPFMLFHVSLRYFMILR